jgi:hypothetical protein
VSNLSSRLLLHAHQLAREIDARAVVVYADAARRDEEFRRALLSADFPTVVALSAKEGLPGLDPDAGVTVPGMPMTRKGRIQAALLVCLARGLLQKGDRVVCLAGADAASEVDTLLVVDLGTEPEPFSLLQSVSFAGDVAPEVFERVLTLAAELAVEGREGRPTGVLFVLGDSERVQAQSRSLVLNPFQGHPKAERNVLDPALEETIKEYAALDGAFIVRGDGVVLTAGTLLVPAGSHPPLPGGLGTRHAAAAAITASTNAVAICVSQSTGTISVFRSGRLVTDVQRPAVAERIPL